MSPKASDRRSKAELLAEVEELRSRLAETEETLRAIREGEVDAIVVCGDRGEQVYSLSGSESVYRLIMETMSEAALTVSLDGRIAFCNGQFGRLVGTPQEQIVGRPLRQFVADGYQAAADSLLLAAQEKTVRQRLVFRSGDDKDVPSHVAANLLRQGDGASICITAADLTELENSAELVQQLRRQRQELEESQQRLAVTTSATGVGLFDWDVARGKVLWTQTHEALFGYVPAATTTTTTTTTTEHDYQHWAGRVHPDDLPGVEEEARRCVQDGRPLKVEYRIVWPDGSLHWIDTRGVVVRGGDGQGDHVLGVAMDITDRKRAEETLRKENAEILLANRVVRQFVEREGPELFDEALRIVQEGMASRHGVFGYISEPGHLLCPSLSKMLDQCEVEGKCIHYPLEKWKGLWARALKEKRSLYSNETARVPPGHPIIHNNLATPILFQGEVIGLLNLANKDGGYTDEDLETLEGIAERVAPILYAWIQRKLRRDDRQAAEAALRESERRYRTLFETMTEGFALHEVITDEQGRPCDYRYLDINPAFERLTGLSRAGLVGNRVLEVLPGTESHWIDGFGRVALTGEPLHLEDYSAALGRWYDVMAYQTAPRQFAVVFTDITDRKQAEAEVAAAHQQLQSVIDNTPSMVYACDLEARFVMANAALTALLKTTPAQILGKRRHEFMPQADADTHEAHDRQVIAAGRPVEFEEHNELHGRSITWLSTKFPLRDAQGRIYAVAGIVTDISDRKQAEEALQKARDELEQRVKERTAELQTRAQQLARLTSELTMAEQRERQHLAQVLHDGLQQLLVAAKFRLSVLESAQEERVREEAAALGELLSDSIETSRSLSAELSPSVLKSGLVPAMEWLARWMEEKHGLTVELHAPVVLAQVPENVTILLFQAARELLFNVVKHSGVKAARVQTTRDDHQIAVTVEDEGRGFDPQRLRHDEGRTGGLGLFAIGERLELLGGHMEMTGGPGQGCRLRLVIPLEREAAGGDESAKQRSTISVGYASASAAPGEPDGQGRLRIALVDDHAVVRQGLATMLRQEKQFQVVGEASDGKSAVELVRRLQPDVVLMDVSMPGMSGLEATRIIHEEFPDVCIIGLSMHDEDHAGDEMRQAGAAVYLNKSGPADAIVKAILSRWKAKE